MQKTRTLSDTQQRVDWDRHLTTGHVSKLLNVASRTVSKWCDTGKLRSHRLPESKDRRILRPDLIAFLIRNEWPIPHDLALPITIAFGLHFGELVPGAETPANLINLGMAIERSVVGLAVIGDAEGLTVGLSACAAIRKRHLPARVVLVVDQSVDVATIDKRVASVVFQRPVNWADTLTSQFEGTL